MRSPSVLGIVPATLGPFIYIPTPVKYLLTFSGYTYLIPLLN